MRNHERVSIAVEAIRHQIPADFTPQLALVLGTGLGDIASLIENPLSIDYEDIPYFPQSTVDSHHGRFIFGTIKNNNGHAISVVVQQGRCHLYEGYHPDDVCMGVRVMAGLGAKKLIITNASGSINPLFEAGSLMLITDHINFTGRSPLTGPNHEEWGPRFPDMSAVYSQALRTIAIEEAAKLQIRLERGIYIGIQGPQLETPAETRMYRAFGADAIGMSTVHEVIAAKHLGLEILGISCLSNLNLPDCMAEATLEDIIRVAALAGQRLSTLLPYIIARM